MRQRWGLLATRIGLVGLVVLLVAFVLTAVSTAAGLHCPGCDRLKLSDEQFAFWEGYFLAKDGVYALATLLLAAAAPFASPRRWPFVLGCALALFAFSLTPM